VQEANERVQEVIIQQKPLYLDYYLFIYLIN